MTQRIQLKFGPDMSQILRGLAIVFMIILHNDTLGEFKICVPIFTFLVGYGYAFAKHKNLRHGLNRSWHLLSNFWVILLGICLPTAILSGGFHATVGNVCPEMFGLESELNWYSWYVYFYLFAMVAMIPASRLITKYGIWAILALTALCAAGCIAIHQVQGWADQMWLKAAFDCLMVSPPMFSGLYLAEGGVVTKLRLKNSPLTILLLLVIATAIFFLRGLTPHTALFDFILVPIFCICVVGIFNLWQWQPAHNLMQALGRQSMHMWFFHALFATATTTAVFGPLIYWIEPKALMILCMIAVSYFAAKIISSVRAKL